MNINADIYYDNYPIREAGQEAGSETRLAFGRQRKLAELMELYQLGIKNRGDNLKQNQFPGALKTIDVDGQLNLPALAKSFVSYNDALQKIHDVQLEEHHISAAFGLLERRVEVIQAASERVLVAGLAATAFVNAGIKVHLVGDDTPFKEIVHKKLVPVFEFLEISFGTITVGDDEQLRRSSYASDITLVCARELAMDFLRDSVNWPKRGNRAHRVVDRLAGRRSQYPHKIMNGLPCAIHLDAQKALITNARAPIVLTQNAHPMHDVEEMQRALELAGDLKAGIDFVYSGDDFEIAFTPAGKSQIDSWVKEFGGIWSVPSAADLMIAISLVVQNLIHRDKHYVIKKGLLEWLVEDRLVPGLLHYSKPFITRVIELKEECTLTGQQEIVGRASYQHVFNRYIHLSGLSHATGMARRELKKVYALNCSNPLRQRSNLKIGRSLLLNNHEEKYAELDRLLTAGAADTSSAVLNLIVTPPGEAGEALRQALELQGKSASWFESADHFCDAILESKLTEECSVLLTPEIFRGVPKQLWRSVKLPVRIIVLYRSIDWYEDELITQFNSSQIREVVDVHQLLSMDDEIFQNHDTKILLFIGNTLSGLGTFGYMIWRNIVELRINNIQKKQAKESYQVRRNLLVHDTGVQSMLSFSGKGLYE